MKIQELSNEERRSRAGFLMSCTVCGEKPAKYEVSTESRAHFMCEGCKRFTLRVVDFLAVDRSHS